MVNSQDQERNSLWHSIFKTLKTQNKERILKVGREKVKSFLKAGISYAYSREMFKILMPLEDVHQVPQNHDYHLDYYNTSKAVF